VRSSACSEGAFIGQGVRGKGGQWVACAWGPGDVHDQHRARRPCSRAGGVWSQRRSSVGRCWRGHAGRQLAERKRDREGGPGGVFPLLPCRTVWVGAEGAGLDRGDVHEHGYRIRARENSDAHSASDFLDSCPPGVRSNARKKFEFKFLKTATAVCQDIGQGFQNYFCYQER
jgi:hypothetical protein